MIDGQPSSIDSPEELTQNVWIIRLVHTQETLITYASLSEDEENPEMTLFLPHVLVKDGDDFVLELFCPFIKDQLVPIDLLDVMFVKTNPCDALRDQYVQLTEEKYGDLIQELEKISFEALKLEAYDYCTDPDHQTTSFYIEQDEPEKFPN